MTRLISCLFAVLLVIGATAHADEVRGAWVSAWSKGYLTPAEADATIAAAKKAKINTLFIQVRKTADAYYNSQIEPKAPNLAADYDPLAYVIEKAHAQGIKVHAWVNVCRVWIGKALPDGPDHLVNKHPEWLNKDSTGANKAADGMFIDPGVPEARDYVVSVISDIAARYAIDGIHLDYIRYPGKDWGYSEEALARYRIESGTTGKPSAGDPKWCEWRREQVTELVTEIRSSVLKARPKIQITAATIAWKDCAPNFAACGPHYLVYQDWCEWLSQGLLDANVPMNYRNDSSSKDAAQFRAWLNGFTRWNAGKPTYVGIDIYHNSAKGIVNQIKAIRKYGLQGFSLFSFNDLPERTAIVAALSKL
ncbi:MAG: family 10 glycosylhydrolase [Armatimonadetes bacterium]|nr:family 10 glycosylhydrolase [Armatimonadota bacterium]